MNRDIKIGLIASAIASIISIGGVIYMYEGTPRAFFNPLDDETREEFENLAKQLCKMGETEYTLVGKDGKSVAIRGDTVSIKEGWGAWRSGEIIWVCGERSKEK